MSTLDKKLYAHLAGQVDDALTELDSMIADGAFDWRHTVRVYEKLKSALLECEERYIDAEDAPPPLVMLPRT